MEDNLLLVVPFKLALIIICDDFKDIRKGLTPTNDTFPHTLETWVQGKNSPCISKPVFHFKTGLAKSTVKRMPKDLQAQSVAREKAAFTKFTHQPLIYYGHKETEHDVGSKSN
jgi:hypothetical protein